MLSVLLQTVRYLWRPTLKDWRRLRAVLRDRLPKDEKVTDIEEKP